MRARCKALLLLMICGIFAPGARAVRGGERDLDRRIEESLKKGANFLLSQKDAGADLEESDSGLARRATMLHTLLSVGRTVDDPRLRDNSAELSAAVRLLAHAKAISSRTASAQILALSLTQLTPESRETLLNDRRVILNALGVSDTAGTQPASTQTADSKLLGDPLRLAEVLNALLVLDHLGIETPAEAWQPQWLRDHQEKDGGWKSPANEASSDKATTAAALATLLAIDQLSLAARPADLIGAQEEHIAADLKKLAEDFDARNHDAAYFLWLKRAARLSGTVRIGGQDWIATAAEQLVLAQQANGSWRGATAEEDEVTATCDALLTLAGVRGPVVFSKLDFGGLEGRATARPYDCATLTQWLSQQFDKSLAWQLVTPHDDLDQWLHTPILLITGSKDPAFADSDIQKLREFVEAGGIIFSSANGDDADFTQAIVTKYAPAMAGRKYEMRELPATHPLLSGELVAKINPPPKLLGLSNGIRELWIHSPTDLGASWQNRKFSAKDDFNLPANLIRYATGMGSIRNRFQLLTIEAPKAAPMRTIELARLLYDGNADPEPGAWRRMSAIAAARFHTRLNINMVHIADLDVARTPVAHFTGTAGFTLSDAEVDALRKFLSAGGTLIADAAGGNAAFADSFRALMKSLYPSIAPADIAVNDPIYNGSLPDSVPVGELEYRKFTTATAPAHDSAPHIQAITIKGRHVVLFSNQDISSGLLGTETWHITGYAPDSAIRLMQNMLLYSASK